MLKIIHDETDANAAGDVATGSLRSSLLDEIVRGGARQIVCGSFIRTRCDGLIRDHLCRFIGVVVTV